MPGGGWVLLVNFNGTAGVQKRNQKHAKLLEALIHFPIILLAKENHTGWGNKFQLYRRDPKLHTNGCNTKKDEGLRPLKRTIYHTHAYPMGRMRERCHSRENMTVINGKGGEDSS